MPDRAPTCQDKSGLAGLSFPNQLAPVRGDYSIPERRCDHALVPMIGPQHMTTAAESPEIGKLVRA